MKKLTTSERLNAQSKAIKKLQKDVCDLAQIILKLIDKK